MVEVSKEPHFILNGGLLESACERPVNSWLYGEERDMLNLAGALMFGIAKNHPFEQGNKRTGFTAGAWFLASNGYRLVVPDDVAVAVDFKAVIEHELEEGEFLRRLSPFVVPI